ncbi:MAG TPA: alpha/beta fold hydrolase [Candidatus Nitrosotalea sp.]|nr:alpha/beta fold hydrolase [Candidatus Nitrosotalea sp.]
MLLTQAIAEFAERGEVSNPYFDYFYDGFVFAMRYGSAVVEAYADALQSFLNARGTAQKIEKNIRRSFDNSLRRNLMEDDLVSSMANFVGSWLEVIRLTGHRQLASNVYNLLSFENRFLEPLRDNVNRTPSELVETRGRFNMLHYKSESKPKHKTPILIVYSLINRYYILDLLPRVSVIKNLQSQGFDVYATDWGTPSSFDSGLSLETYAEEYVGGAIEKIREMTGCEKVSLFGYCWGGLFALIHAATHKDDVKNLVLHATPLDIEKEETVVEKWTAALDADKLVEACGNVPGWLLNLAFVLRNPAETILKYPRYFSEPRTLDEIAQFFAIETWLYDSRPIIGRVYREIVDQIYKDNLLIKNKMRVGSDTLDLKNIDMPLLDIVGTKDDLVPPSSCKSIMDKIGSADKRLIEFPTGHVGLCISDEAHEKLWPEVGRWLAERS